MESAGEVAGELFESEKVEKAGEFGAEDVAGVDERAYEGMEKYIIIRRLSQIRQCFYTVLAAVRLTTNKVQTEQD